MFIIGKNDGYPMKIGKCFLPKMNFKKSTTQEKKHLESKTPHKIEKSAGQKSKIQKIWKVCKTFTRF